MKKISVLLLPVLYLSCQQNSFDLGDFTFPIKKDSLTTKFKFRTNADFSNFIIHDTKDKEAMCFYGLKLSGTGNNNEESYFMANYTSFYEDKKSKEIDAFQIKTSTTAKSLELEKLLEEKFGKTDFYYKSEKFSNRIWEIGDKVYFFDMNYTGNYDGESFTGSTLYVVNPKNKMLYDFPIAGGFQYYGNYLREKQKEEHKNKKYSYKDFVIEDELEKKKWGDESYYSKNYVK